MKTGFLVCFVALFACAGVVSEVWAECKNESGVVDCRASIDNGKNAQNEYICGTGCTFTIEGETIKIKANSANARIDEGIFAPNYYQDGKFKTSDGQEVSFNKIELDGDFAYIGGYAFYNSGATITTTSGVLNIKDAGGKIARGNTTIEADIYISSDEACNRLTFQSANIKGDLVFADGVTNVASWFMGRATIDGNVVIPSSLSYIMEDNYITLLDTLDKGNKVYCGANNCYQLFYDACYRDTRANVLSECLDKLNDLVEGKKLFAYPDGCTELGLGLRCSKCKNGNFRLNDGECDRLRYTPAEAAKVLKDTDNELIMTFKVNR
ncbi:MAG: hypothetical protein IKO06_02915 [Alphaproteobacteria bacterium]|nr:hypothetical protein [Alphaproteobacteria bacterium]